MFIRKWNEDDGVKALKETQPLIKKNVQPEKKNLNLQTIKNPIHPYGTPNDPFQMSFFKFTLPNNISGTFVPSKPKP